MSTKLEKDIEEKKKAAEDYAEKLKKESNNTKLTINVPDVPNLSLRFLNPKNELYGEILKPLTILLTLQFLKEVHDGEAPFSNNDLLYDTLFFIIGVILYHTVIKKIT